MPEPNGAPSAGFLRGRTHILPVRVYYEDTDFTGVVYHASYLRYLERGRTDALRGLGFHHAALWALTPPLAFAVRKLTIEYLVPARIDDGLQVLTGFDALQGPRLVMRQSVERDGERLVEAKLEVVFITGEGRPRKPPEDLRRALQPLLTSVG